MNYRTTLYNELYKQNLGVDFCEDVSDLLCNTEGNEESHLVHDCIESRLILIKKAIQNTLVKWKTKKQTNKQS